MDTSTNMLGLFLYIDGAFCRVVPKVAPSCVEKLQYQGCILVNPTDVYGRDRRPSLGPCLSRRKNSTERHFSSLLFCRLLEVCRLSLELLLQDTRSNLHNLHLREQKEHLDCSRSLKTNRYTTPLIGFFVTLLRLSFVFL